MTDMPGTILRVRYSFLRRATEIFVVDGEGFPAATLIRSFPDSSARVVEPLVEFLGRHGVPRQYATQFGCRDFHDTPENRGAILRA